MPGQQPGPTIAPRPRRGGAARIAFIVVGCVLAVCAIGGAVAYCGFRSLSDAIGPPQEATEAFLRDLQSGDTSSAYARLCAATRDQVAQDRFAAMVGTRRPTAFRVVGVHVSNVNGRVSATVNANLSYPDGFVDQHVFRLTKEDGAWKVCGNPY